MTLLGISIPEDAYILYDVDAVIATINKHNCLAYEQPFIDRAKELQESGDSVGMALYQLLAATCSMILVADTKTKPFQAAIQFDDQRSPTLDDFSDEEIKTLAAFSKITADTELRARLADMAWMRHIGGYLIVHDAVNAYIETAYKLGSRNDWGVAAHRYKRALHLSLGLGKGGIKLLDTTVVAIEEALANPDLLAGNFYAEQLMGLLLLVNRGDADKYTKLTDIIANIAQNSCKWDLMRTYLEMKLRWLHKAQNSEGEQETLLRIAESYTTEAKQEQNTDTPSTLRICFLLQQAIEAYRRIGNQKQRIEELHKLLLKFEEKSHNDLQSLSTEVDVTAFARNAQEAVRGKEMYEAIFKLAQFGGIGSKSLRRAFVLDLTSRTPIQFLVNRQLLNDHGKVIGIRPPILSGSEEERELALVLEMHTWEAMSRSPYAQACILPALMTIREEHNPQMRDILPIVTNNPFVPHGRELSYARGLSAGFANEWAEVLYFLVPQFENSIRFVLEERGSIVNSLTSVGIQKELSLNELLKLSQSIDIFGEDLVFTMEGLLCEQFGDNLRNKAAHGLMNDDDANSLPVVYLWWLTLHICCIQKLHVQMDKKNNIDIA